MMKTLKILGLSFLILMSFNISFSSDISAQKASTKQTYKVKGMHCSSCVRSIKASICELPGISKCKVKLGEITFVNEGEKKYSLPELNEILKNKGSYELYQ